MKTAISVPDEIFHEAERLARRAKRSRSELYSQALREYVARHAPERVTELMNETLAHVGKQDDAFVTAAARTRSTPQRMVISQGEVWWASLPEPIGSSPGLRRPVVVVQGDPLNRSAIATVVCVPLTSNTKWATAPGNVLLPAAVTGLPKESVANASQLVALDRALLTDRTGKLSKAKLGLVLSGIDIILDR